MLNIVQQVVIQAQPASVYQALTERDGLASWWTVNTQAEPAVGAVDEFGFNGGRFVIKMEVAELELNKKIVWKVRQGVPEWNGTHVTWDLTALAGQTVLLFGHHDYPENESSFADARNNWAGYIASLKAYLETGQGTPNPG